MKELIEIQKELKAPKGQYNSFGKYKYRSAEDILESVKPLCAKYGCELTLSDEMVYIGDRYYIKATAKIEHEGSSSVSVSAYAREAETKKGMDESQITGTASSYARKYALNGLFCIDDTKDADTDEYVKKTRSAKKSDASEVTEGGIDYLRNLCRDAGVQPVYKGKNIEDLSKTEYMEAVEAIEQLVEEKKE